MESRTDHIKLLQQNKSCIRNICIIAHVDHGKTTLSDSLLSSNGIISSKLAGKIRYLDSREDEQERGITMESSGISLFFKMVEQVVDEESQEKKLTTNEYLINLIDSPGHVDFSSEVSTASRICDGGLLLVDAVEGVCAQTHTVLRQAIEENVKPVLVLNKIDRLITDLKQTPEEAFVHLTQILEQVNAILGSFEAHDLMRENELNSELNNEPKDDEEEEREDYYFSPEKGNVIFASAIDGWAFRTNQFAKIYATKLGVDETKLNRFLWGKFFLDPKTKRIISPKGLKNRQLKPLFVQFILDNIWAVYENIYVNYDGPKIEKIIKSLGVKIPPRELKPPGSRNLLQSIMSQWLPLARAVLVTVVQKIPSPIEAQSYRLAEILNSGGDSTADRSTLVNAIQTCDTSDTAPVVAFLSKMFSVSSADLPAKAVTRSNEDTEEEEVLIGFARIYSGTIKVGQSIYILGPKYNAEDPDCDQFKTEIVVERLFLLMGKEMRDLECVPAGNIFGIMGCQTAVLKTATLSTSLICPSLAGVKMEAPPILRVALEPKDPTQMNQLLQGLELLNRADPCVEIQLEETGENVIACAGELHVERCVKDLRERFAKIEIQVSKPLVQFKETLSEFPAQSSNTANSGLPTGTVIKSNPEKTVEIKLRVIPLPALVRSCLLDISARLATIKGNDPSAQKAASAVIEELRKAMQNSIDENECPNIDINWSSLIDKIVTFGPKYIGPNMLISNLDVAVDLWVDGFAKNSDHKALEYYTSIVSGFQVATNAGPLCAEPLAGVAVILESYTINTENSDQLTYLPGQIVSMINLSIRQGFLQWSPRLMLAMYSCELQTEATHLGRVDGVLSRRRGKILSEDIKEGTPLFTLVAAIPVVESFGLVDELRKKTSGVASPQLVFSGFEVLDLDPFWVPTTEEELEDLGDKADRENLAKKYMESVRLRKGMAIEKKLVENAEKQRTIKK
ncbi:P-loop containing nucleoside triphosphate hydrolase protein [Globomyces pollinis-pini]|nr:P-loop containing nucleoside triphosphate hydrolase protein [Globomyces pollinis-pini]